MKYMTAPSPAKLHGPNGSVDYGLANLLNEFVWTSPAWRSDATHRKAFAALCSKLSDEALAAGPAALTDEEFEPLSRVLQAIDLRTMPQVARQLTTLINHVLDAPSEAPSKEP